MTAAEFTALTSGGFSNTLEIPEPIGDLQIYFYVEFSGNDHDYFDVVADVQHLSERTIENFDSYDPAIDDTEPQTVIKPLYLARNQFEYISGFLRQESENELFNYMGL